MPVCVRTVLDEPFVQPAEITGIERINGSPRAAGPKELVLIGGTSQSAIGDRHGIDAPLAQSEDEVHT